MKNINESIPSLSEEIHRKAMDALVWIEHSVETGSISQSEAYVSTQALFIALSGLVGPMVSSLLSASCSRAEYIKQEAVLRDSEVVLLTLKGEGILDILRLPLDAGVQRQHSVHSSSSFEGGMRLMKRAKNLFLKAGYKGLFEEKS